MGTSRFLRGPYMGGRSEPTLAPIVKANVRIALPSSSSRSLEFLHWDSLQTRSVFVLRQGALE